MVRGASVSEAALALAVLVSACCPCGAEGAIRPTAAECSAAVPPSGLGRVKLAASVALRCSKWTLWVPSFRRRCCNSLQALIGEGGDLAFCLCDAASAEYAASQVDALGVNTQHLAGMCEDDFGMMLPYMESATCPPPQPVPTPSPAAQSVAGVAAPAAQFPSQETCEDQAEDIGQAALIKSLAPCLLGASDACCTAGEALIGPGGGMEYCLCNPDSADFITDQAVQFGVDVLALMQSCTDQGYQVPFDYNSLCFAR